MPDTATSTAPAVQAQLDRLFAHGPGTDTLGLDRITRLLARLGDPHRLLPPVFHVAGTNGKGSTCAFLRAALEAGGHRVHVYTSPHLVRFNERIRLAGKLIDDEALAPLLAEVLDVAEDLNASFFEVTTAATFLAFARTPADACVVEVGLGGRLDATNVVSSLVTGIAALGIDHEAFLLTPEAGTPADPLERIAWEKAGIAKADVPLVTLAYPASVAAVIADHAERQHAPLMMREDVWSASIFDGRLRYTDVGGELDLPLPALSGPHQPDNAALAIAMLRHQQALVVDAAALAQGLAGVSWPGRMQRLRNGPLVIRLPAARRQHGVWLDGAHNAAAAQAIAGSWAAGAPTALVIGVLANKDAAGILGALVTPDTHVVAVPVPGHAHHAPEALAARAQELGAASAVTAGDAEQALDRVAATPAASVLIAGSLYLAGEVLRLNDELPE